MSRNRVSLHMSGCFIFCPCVTVTGFELTCKRDQGVDSESDSD